MRYKSKLFFDNPRNDRDERNRTRNKSIRENNNNIQSYGDVDRKMSVNEKKQWQDHDNPIFGVDHHNNHERRHHRRNDHYSQYHRPDNNNYGHHRSNHYHPHERHDRNQRRGSNDSFERYKEKKDKDEYHSSYPVPPKLIENQLPTNSRWNMVTYNQYGPSSSSIKHANDINALSPKNAENTTVKEINNATSTVRDNVPLPQININDKHQSLRTTSQKVAVDKDVNINDKDDIVVETISNTTFGVTNLKVSDNQTTDSLSSITFNSGSKRKYTSMNPHTSTRKSRKGKKNPLHSFQRHVDLKVRQTMKQRKEFNDLNISDEVKKEKKKARRKLSIQQQGISETIENNLLRLKMISQPLLRKSVFIQDRVTGDQYQTNVVRCWYVNEDTKEVHWRCTVSGNLDLTIDTATCQDIVEGYQAGSMLTYHLDEKNKLANYQLYSSPFSSVANNIQVAPKSLIVEHDDKHESCSCVFCGANSKNIRKDPNRICTYTGTTGVFRQMSNNNKQLLKDIKCIKCNASSCIRCVLSLCDSMEKNNDHIGDEWYTNVVNVLSSGQEEPKILGHCCEIKESIKVARRKIPKKNETLKSRRYCGNLYLPQLHIMIDTPLKDFVDIHGLGKENNDSIPGLIHGVVGKFCAEQCQSLNVIPTGNDCIMEEDVVKLIEFTDMFGVTNKVTCLIHTVLIDHNINTKTMTHNEVDHSSLLHCKMLEHPSYVDAWVILAKQSSSSKECHLVNMRWRSNLKDRKWNTNSFIESFYSDLVKNLKTDGLDAKRVGGSNGYTTYNNTNILKLLKSNDAFVRKGKGVKLVKDRKKWKCYYLKAGKGKNEDGSSILKNEREFTRYMYSQPQPSGNFEMNEVILDKYYDVVEAMTIAKYNAPLLLKEINSIMSLCVQEKAVFEAIEDLNRATDLATSCKQSRFDFKKQLVRQLAMDNLYTIVAYPCNYHFDVFKKGQYSLENKICFSFIPSSTENTGLIGRGGGDEEEYTWGWLDWSNSSQGRRRRQFIASGASLKKNEAVTQKKWNSRFNKE